MTEPLLRFAAEALPFVPVLLTLGLGGLAIRALRGERLRARPERRSAVALAAITALVLAAVVELYAASIYGMDTGLTPQAFAAVLPAAAVALGAGFLAGLVGYVALARGWASPGSALGGLIGAPLFVVAMLGALGLTSALQHAAYEAGSADAADALAARSEGITIRTELLEARADASGNGMASVHVLVTIKSDHDVVFEVASKDPTPRFVFANVGQNMIDAEPGPSDPQALEAGVDEVWDLTFDVPELEPYSGTYAVPGPGTWTLRVMFTDSAGESYELNSDVAVEPKA